MIHHHKPECPVKKKGLLHSGSKSQQRVKILMFVQMFVKTTKRFVTKLCTVMHYYESECHAKRLVCYFQGQGHCKSSYDQTMTIFFCIFWTADPFATKLGLIVHYYNHKCFMEKLDHGFKVKITANFKISVNVCSDDIFWVMKPFATKLGMVMHYCKPDCLSKRSVCYLQGRGHS